VLPRCSSDPYTGKEDMSVSSRATITAQSPTFENKERFVRLIRQTSSIESVEPTIAIVTALDIEFFAVESSLKIRHRNIRTRELPLPQIAGIPILTTGRTLQKGDKIHDIVLAQTQKMGNNSSAVATTALLMRYPSIKLVLFVGIAGGIPTIEDELTTAKQREEHIRLGDVMVADCPVIQYDFVKWEPDKFSNRSVANQVSPDLLRVIQQLKSAQLKHKSNSKQRWRQNVHKLLREMDSTWKRPPRHTDKLTKYKPGPDGKLQKENAGHPTQTARPRGASILHFGKIGSANLLLKDPFGRDEVMRTHGVRAIEMEGSGMADAAWAFNVGYGLVRGVCDYCDMEKADDWQKFASLSAASVARELIDLLLFPR